MDRRIMILISLLVAACIVCGCAAGGGEEQSAQSFDLQLEVCLESGAASAEVRVDGEKVGTVLEGQAVTPLVHLPAGEHIVSFHGGDGAEASATVSLDADKAFSCTLKGDDGIEIADPLEEPLKEYQARIEDAKKKAEEEKAAQEEAGEEKKSEAEKQSEEEQWAAEEKAQAEQEALQKTLDGFVGKPLADVYEELEALGLDVGYIAADSDEDLTAEVGKDLANYFFTGYQIAYLEDTTSVTVRVMTASAMAEEQEKAELNETLDVIAAWEAAQDYGASKYPNLKINYTYHMVDSYYNGKPNEDGTAWILKSSCTYEVGGKTVDGICEAVVGGTTEEPVVLECEVY